MITGYLYACTHMNSDICNNIKVNINYIYILLLYGNQIHHAYKLIQQRFKQPLNSIQIKAMFTSAKTPTMFTDISVHNSMLVSYNLL